MVITHKLNYFDLVKCIYIVAYPVPEYKANMYNMHCLIYI